MTIYQSDISRELEVSEMTVSRAVSALGCTSRPLDDYDAFRLIFASELQGHGLAWHVVVELMAEFSQEIRYVFRFADRRAWLIFVDNDRTRFDTVATSEAVLASMLDLFPLALTLPLHSIAENSRQRLSAVKARKDAA